MDSVFNDMEFLMGNIKQESPNSNGHAEPFAEGRQNNDTEQLTMSTYMTDFILDYINRTLKNDEEESQQDNNLTEAENEEESVDDLLERAETMIRENMEQLRGPTAQGTNTGAVMNNGWMQTVNGQEGSSLNNITINYGHSSTNPPIEYPLASGSSLGITIHTGNCTNACNSTVPTENRSHGPEPPIVVADNEVSDVIFVDTDSDDEVIFVNHQLPTEIPVIDLSDHSSQSENISRPTSRKRTNDNTPASSVPAPAPAPAAKEKSPEKQFRHSCAVCLEDVKAPHSTTCGHIYCGECIKNSIKIFKKCPTCNKKLKISHVHPIYL